MNIFLTNKVNIIMNIAKKWHGYPINIVLGSYIIAAAQDPAREYCMVQCVTCRIQATEPRLIGFYSG